MMLPAMLLLLRKTWKRQNSKDSNGKKLSMQKDVYLLALALTPDVGPVISRTLIGYCGSPEAVFKEPISRLRKIPGIGEATIKRLKDKGPIESAEKELEYCEASNIRIIDYMDAAYPTRLKQIDSAPVLLFVKGESNLNPKRVVGIVGTRKATSYGISACERIIEELRPYNCVIASGLAYGIDITAHRACLIQENETWAVMGNGMDRIYPFLHRGTAMEIEQKGGLLITEFASFTKADRERFPARNRILAALCDAVVVIESSSRGGSIITANFAFDYDREVYALPGRVTDPQSAGCLDLIRTNKAAVVTSGTDIAKSLFWDVEDEGSSGQRELFPQLEQDEDYIFQILTRSEPVSMQEIIVKSSWTVSKIANTLLKLEFKGLVRTLPGNLYLRL
jgi:DNA processing protein